LTDGITDLNPEGLTAATGKWANQGFLMCF
jgi:hypothetical protein